jgi:predicted  nucleic acid-binding Zn-ribbon protein
MASKLKAAAGSFERILLPRLDNIDGEIKALNTKIDATNTRIDSTKSELRTEISSMKNELRAEMTSNKNEIKSHIRALSEKVDILPRLAVLEARIKELEKRS